jgi:hypothetical protein
MFGLVPFPHRGESIATGYRLTRHHRHRVILLVASWKCTRKENFLTYSSVTKSKTVGAKTGRVTTEIQESSAHSGTRRGPRPVTDNRHAGSEGIPKAE